MLEGPEAGHGVEPPEGVGADRARVADVDVEAVAPACHEAQTGERRSGPVPKAGGALSRIRFLPSRATPGRDLRDGSLVTTANRLANESQAFDVEMLTLRMDANTYTLFGSFGVTDRLDIGAAIPAVDLNLSGERLNFYRGAVFQQASGSAFVYT